MSKELHENPIACDCLGLLFIGRVRPSCHQGPHVQPLKSRRFSPGKGHVQTRRMSWHENGHRPEGGPKGKTVDPIYEGRMTYNIAYNLYTCFYQG